MKLSDALKELLATTFTFYYKAHAFHWNIEGADFYEYHKLLEDIYSDAYASIDPTAEYIRSLDQFAPPSLSRLAELSKIQEQKMIPPALDMLQELLTNNTQIQVLLIQVFNQAQAEDQQGIANFIADRQSQHGKWHWQLKATLK